jgi:hypothetical protein
MSDANASVLQFFPLAQQGSNGGSPHTFAATGTRHHHHHHHQSTTNQQPPTTTHHHHSPPRSTQARINEPYVFPNGVERAVRTIDVISAVNEQLRLLRIDQRPLGISFDDISIKVKVSALLIVHAIAPCVVLTCTHLSVVGAAAVLAGWLTDSLAP